jgi:hypothetical protein
VSKGKRRRGRKSGRARAADEAAAIYLDHLHRDDSSQSRTWNAAPPPGTRRPAAPEIPAGYARVASSDVERVLGGAPDEELFFITTRDGGIKLLRIRKDRRS